ncbi:ABC transporter ATP-binding protein [Anoxynatronum buryatiense]|uniref:ABC-2 type transport system ATP-binding protein n=1 Tax=Anoxynatronum buryatiense TaxID=489973 RepID=A0AA46AIH0_9CLOT|nr:ABC transporter ATP-binding protein [Anoxynatronum buryatiense]SMP50893.1 ABC-2 type transport system ATP-binding protein [Anoxynatronum buryatiense]
MTPVIEMKGLRMRYGSEGPYVLNGIDLSVTPGSIIGYIGPNGAGKSTTVKIMLGMVQDYEGDVLIFGENIRENPVAYKRRIGYVPEAAVLYDSLSGFEYLRFIGDLYDMEADDITAKGEQLFELFGIGDALHHRISSYSKGMKQKLMIIASLIHNPDILFFDEPISGLDANSVMIFKALMQQLARQGKTIFYSSHIMEVVEKISHRIVVLHQGQVVADGSFEMLQEKNHEGTLQEVFNQLTGFHSHEAIAASFAQVVTGNTAAAGTVPEGGMLK